MKRRDPRRWALGLLARCGDLLAVADDATCDELLANLGLAMEELERVLSGSPRAPREDP